MREDSRPSRPLWIAATLLVALLAGCATGPGDVVPGRSQAEIYDGIEANLGIPDLQGHDHGDPSLHSASANLDLLAARTGRADNSRLDGESYAETAVKGDYAYLSRFGPESGLSIFDVSDIANPRFVSHLRLDAGYEPDIEVSDDGNWAFWSTQRHPLSLEAPKPDPGANLPRGIHVVDISDKTNPRWVGFQPVTPDGPHSITYANIDGRHIVFSSTYSYLYVRQGINAPMQQRLILYELDASGPVATMRNLYEYTDPNAGQFSLTDRGGMFPHDVSVSVHPLTGRTYAYVAYWDLGVVILDVTDPAHPVKVGQAVDFGPASYRAIHMARQFPHTIDGRVIMVAEPEISGREDSGYMGFIDVTDPTRPQYVSSWRIPGNHSTEIGGPHYFDLRNGRVALSHYHAGFWVIDVHDAENLAKPRTVGFALVNATGRPVVPGMPAGQFAGLGAGSAAFDAWWVDDEHIVGGDFHAGLVVYRYTGPKPMPDEKLNAWP